MYSRILLLMTLSISDHMQSQNRIEAQSDVDPNHTRYPRPSPADRGDHISLTRVLVRLELLVSTLHGLDSLNGFQSFIGGTDD